MDHPKLAPVKVKPQCAEGDAADAASTQLNEQSDSAQPLSPTARFFLSDVFYTTVLCALEFKDRLAIDELRTILSDTLLKHPRFHSRMEKRGCNGGEQVWVRTQVDLAYHVVEGTESDQCDSNEGAGGAEEAARPAESRSAESESPCCEEGSVEWHMRRLQHMPPFDPSHPLWRVHLVSLPHGRSAALFRIHHSLGDGVSLMSLLLACTRRTDDPALLPTIPGAKRQSPSQPPVQVPAGTAASGVDDEKQRSKQGGSNGDAGEEESSGGLVVSEELQEQLVDADQTEEENLKPGQPQGQLHMPSAASAFTLDSMTASPFTPQPDGLTEDTPTAAQAAAGGGATREEGAGSAAEKGGGRGGVKGVVGVRRRAWQVALVLGNTLWHVAAFMAVLMWRADTDTCVKMKAGKGKKGGGAVVQQPDGGRGGAEAGGGNGGGENGGRFVFGVSGPLSLSDISRVRRAFGATINDVSVTIISGGLDRYLQHHHAQAKEAGEPAPVVTSPLPASVRLSALCLVNIRPTPGLQEMASMLAGRSKARWGNCLGTFLLPLPVHSPSLTKGLPNTEGANVKNTDENAAGEVVGRLKSSDEQAAGEVEGRRLRMVAAMCASKRQSLEAHYNYVNARLVLATAGMKAAGALMHRLCHQTTISFSNMMGPVEEVSLGGHAIARISPTVVGQPHALTLHFQTYNGSAHIVLSALRENVPDPAFLLRCCEDAFHALKASLK
ncbi:hypothetical protein CLOM_g606 [Closterium sp. NIES-68]|nr:hypothetical protein CLOM_g606 [Closterium sp. NIES-68]